MAQTFTRALPLDIFRQKVVYSYAKGGEDLPFDKGAYDAEYNRTHYETIGFSVPKGGKKKLRAVADEYGWSISKLIINALERLYGVDLHTKQ